MLTTATLLGACWAYSNRGTDAAAAAAAADADAGGEGKRADGRGEMPVVNAQRQEQRQAGKEESHGGLDLSFFEGIWSV